MFVFVSLNRMLMMIESNLISYDYDIALLGCIRFENSWPVAMEATTENPASSDQTPNKKLNFEAYIRFNTIIHHWLPALQSLIGQNILKPDFKITCATFLAILLLLHFVFMVIFSIFDANEKIAMTAEVILRPIIKVSVWIIKFTC